MSAPPPRPPRCEHAPSLGQGGQQPRWVLHPRWGVQGPPCHMLGCYRHAEGAHPPRHCLALPATRQHWALRLSTQSLHSSQRAASFLCKGHVFNSKLGFQGHRGALTLNACLALVPLPPPLPPPQPLPPSTGSPTASLFSPALPPPPHTCLPPPQFATAFLNSLSESRSPSPEAQ